MPKTKQDGDTRPGEASLAALATQAALPTVNKPKRIRKPKSSHGIRGRFAPPLVAALEYMGREGVPLSVAAERAGMQPNSLKIALRKPHVKTALNQIIADVRSGAAQAAYLRINHLGVVAESENVRLEANKWVAGVDNIAPVRRVEGRYQVSHSFGGFMFDDDGTVDVTPDDTSSETDSD